MTTVWHVFPNRINMGDWASVIGIRLFLEKALSGPVDWRDLLMGEPVDDAMVERINAEADLVVIGGGGVWQRKTNTASGWLWDISIDRLRRIQKPLAIWGVGLNDWYHRPGAAEPSQAAIAHIVETATTAVACAVRDQWTADWLSANGGPAAPVLPCPSLCIGNAASAPTARSGRIAVNVLPRAWLHRPRALRSVLTRVLRPRLAEGWTVSYISHGPAPEDTLNELTAVLPGDVVVGPDPISLSDAYGQAEVAIVMRQHALALAFAGAAPAIPLSYSRKCETMAEHTGAHGHLVRWQPRRWPSSNRDIADRLSAMIDQVCADHASLRQDIDRRRQVAAEASAAFAAEVAAIVSNR